MSGYFATKRNFFKPKQLNKIIRQAVSYLHKKHNHNVWPHRPKLCAIMSLPFQVPSRWRWGKSSHRWSRGLCSARTTPVPATPHHSQEESWATIKLACKKKKKAWKYLFFMHMVFKSLPSNQHAFSLGSEPFMAPAVQFMKACLKTLDFCQVGRQSCLWGKGQESCTSRRGRASSLQVTAVPGAINFCLWLWLKVKWVCHL